MVSLCLVSSKGMTTMIYASYDAFCCSTEAKSVKNVSVEKLSLENDYRFESSGDIMIHMT